MPVIVVLFITNMTIYLEAEIQSLFVLENWGWSMCDISLPGRNFLHRFDRQWIVGKKLLCGSNCENSSLDCYDVDQYQARGI